MNKTKIEWTDFTWNPVTGCKHGCEYCYARRIAARFKQSFEPTIHWNRLDAPSKVKKRSRVFVCSMSDLFGAWIPERWIFDVMKAVIKAPQHTYQFLTKNPSRVKFYKFPHSAWVGATATSHRTLVLSCEDLTWITDSVRFISVEPMLEPIRYTPGAGENLNLIIIGAKTGPGGFVPPREWIDNLTNDAIKHGVKVFHKDNLMLPEGDRMQELSG